MNPSTTAQRTEKEAGARRSEAGELGGRHQGGNQNRVFRQPAVRPVGPPGLVSKTRSAPKTSTFQGLPLHDWLSVSLAEAGLTTLGL